MPDADIQCLSKSKHKWAKWENRLVIHIIKVSAHRQECPFWADADITF